MKPGIILARHKMNAELDKLDRYSEGGDIYEAIAEDYGKAAAESVLKAYKSGENGAVAEALATIRNGAPLETSTLKIFGNQLATDPFSAPLSAANKIIGTITSSAIFGILKNPFVLLLLVVLALIYIPGFRKFAGRKIKVK